MKFIIKHELFGERRITIVFRVTFKYCAITKMTCLRIHRTCDGSYCSLIINKRCPGLSPPCSFLQMEIQQMLPVSRKLCNAKGNAASQSKETEMKVNARNPPCTTFKNIHLLCRKWFIARIATGYPATITVLLVNEKHTRSACAAQHQTQKLKHW